MPSSGSAELTPVQAAVSELAGVPVKGPAKQELEDFERAAIISRGLHKLRHLTGVDFGFDLEQWHQFLSTNDVGRRLGYREGTGARPTEERVRAALADPGYDRVVTKLLTESVT